MRIYISLPMAGHLDTVKSRYEKALLDIIHIYGPDAEIVGPHNMEDFDDDGLVSSVKPMPWSWHLGEDIKSLLECTHIYLCQGWVDSRGCNTEVAVAKVNGIQIIYGKNAMGKLD